MKNISKITGLIFDVSKFHIGWTYRITSEYFNCDNAVCNSVCPGSITFMIDDGKKIELTPALVGAMRYRFEHRIDVPMKEELK